MTLDELRARYRELAAGSPRRDEIWLNGMGDVIAHIHPDDRASGLVAARAGLEPTGDEVDGEQVWRTPEAVEPTS